MILDCAECGERFSDVEVISFRSRYSRMFAVRCNSCGYMSQQEHSRSWAVRRWNNDQRDYYES